MDKTTQQKRVFAVLPLLVLAIAACDPHTERSPAEVALVEEQPGARVQLSDSESREFGVELSTASAGRIATTVELPGEILANQDRLAHIVPRFPGVVKSVHKSTGDAVERGDSLVTIESSESLSSYSVKSLLAGVVIERHVAVGEAVTTGRELFVVADLSDVWVDFQAFQKHLPHLAVGQRVHITAGHGLPEAEAIVSYISPVVDETTRTATVRAVVPNQDGEWRPGLFVTGRVETTSVDVDIAVPSTAVQTVAGVPVVFVEDGAGFIARPIRTGRSGPHQVEVIDGLAAGESFAARGAFTLKAELQRGDLGEGHGH